MSHLRHFIGSFIIAIAYTNLFISFAAALFLVCFLIYIQQGLWLTIASVVLFPVTISFGSIAVGIFLKYWLPCSIIAQAFVVNIIFAFAGTLIYGKNEEVKESQKAAWIIIIAITLIALGYFYGDNLFYKVESGKIIV